LDVLLTGSASERPAGGEFVNTAPQLGSLGKYRLIASIGHGGMAHIHLALMAGPAGFNSNPCATTSG
jgi:hypothetical protein